MSDDTPTPVEPSAPEAEPSQVAEKPKNRSAALIGCLIVLAIIAVIVVLIFLSRGCSGATSGSKAPASSTSSTSVSPLSLQEKIHAAIHAPKLANGDTLDTMVYIFTVANDGAVKVTLIEPSAILAQNPATNPKMIATKCEDAILAAVSEVTSVTVVDSSGVVISTKKRTG